MNLYNWFVGNYEGGVQRTAKVLHPRNFDLPQ